MDRRTLTTLFRWLVRGYPPVFVDMQLLFMTAYGWKYGRNGGLQLTYCWHAYLRKGHLPEFVKEFIRSEVYATLLKGGQGEKATGHYERLRLVYSNPQAFEESC